MTLVYGFDNFNNSCKNWQKKRRKCTHNSTQNLPNFLLTNVNCYLKESHESYKQFALSNKFDESSFSKLPDDILLLIRDYIADNKTLHNLSMTCKYVNTLYTQHGYLKNLYVTHVRCSMSSFLQMNVKHILTLNTISFANFFDPHYWIMGNWAKTVYFMNCTFSKGKLAPLFNTNVENLYLECNKDIKITIDFKNFKNLRKLYLYCHDVVLQNIDSCTKLENINISVNTRSKNNNII